MAIVVNTSNLKNSSKGSTRYTQGGLVDIYNNRLGWWERRVIPKHSTDIFFDIDINTEHRPDLIAFAVYKNPKYAWVVLQFNNIVDINEELVAGKTITLPSSSRLQSVVLSKSANGNIVE